jgi:hypothetical protein
MGLVHFLSSQTSGWICEVYYLLVRREEHPMKVNKWLKWSFIIFILSGLIYGCSPQPPEITTPTVDSRIQTPTEAETAIVIDPLPPPVGSTPTPTHNPTPVIPMWGVENHNSTVHFVSKMQEAGVTLVRRNALRWAHIEPEEGKRNWDAVVSLEEDLQRLSEAGMEIILIVHTTPPWAQQAPGYQCSAVRGDKLEAFADFIYEAVSRYSYPPYNVKFWELGNEPDVAPHLVHPDYPFGCWGDEEDPYYGAAHYTDMLKLVYPAIKAANPEAQVLLGGLLLHCDPSLSTVDNECLPGKFFEGVLRAGGGNFFDIVSFHGYMLYFGSLKFDIEIPGWAHRGGIVLGKADYLKEVMRRYQIDKPIIHSESALTCPEGSPDAPNIYCNPPEDAFYEAQADYVIWLYIRNWAAGIGGTIWYQFEGKGWRHGGLLGAGPDEAPAFRAYKFLTEYLGDAEFVRKIDAMGALQVYEFAKTENRVWVAWPSDEQVYTIQLSGDVTQVFDKYGEVIEVTPSEITIQNPVYIELTP